MTEQDSSADPSANRRAILSAATKLFAAHGFAATSMADIAKEAGVTKSLILYHFATKDELWRAVMQAKTRPFFEVTQGLVDGGVVHISDMMRAKFEANRKDSDLTRLMAWMSLEHRQVAPEFNERARKIRERVIRDGQTLGIPEGVDPEMFLALVMSAIDGWFRFRHLYGTVFGTNLVGEEAEEAFLRVLFSVCFGEEDGGAR